MFGNVLCTPQIWKMRDNALSFALMLLRRCYHHIARYAACDLDNEAQDELESDIECTDSFFQAPINH